MTNLVVKRAVIACPTLKLTKPHRVVWTDNDLDRCVAIACKQDRMQGPRILRLSELESMVGTPNLTFSVWAPDPRALMDDVALAQAYPALKDEAQSFPVVYRKRWGDTIRPIHARVAEVWRGERSLHKLIHEVMGEDVAGLWRIYENLYRFWAAGSRFGAVLPATDKSGGRGQKRAGRVTVPLGRKTLAAAEAGLPNNNFVLTEEIIEQIQTAWRRLVKPYRGPRKAYRLFLAAFYVERWEGEGSSLKPVIFRRGQRPSLRQFYEHGRSQNRSESAFRKMLGEEVFALQARAFEGVPSEKGFATGGDGEVDSSSGDTYLKSAFDRLRDVGPCKVIFVVCAETGYIHAGLPCWRVNKETVKLAILLAASDKVEYCARFGIEITKDDWIPTLFTQFVADHGEANSEPVREYLAGLECSIVYVRRRRGDDKPRVEQAIRRTHKHDQPGSTHGRLHRRGEDHPAKLAAYNVHEFTADLIEAILWANNHQVVRKLAARLPEADIPPTRAGALKYSIANGTHTDHAYHAHELLVALCPEYPAVVTREGVFLVVRRRGDAGDRLLLKNFPYRPQGALWTGWSEKVAQSGHRFEIRVRVKAFDLSAIYYLDALQGLIQLDLVSTNPELKRIAVLEDAIQHETWDTIKTDAARENELETAVRRDLNQEAREMRSKDSLRTAKAGARRSGVARNAEGRRANRRTEEELGGHYPSAELPIVTDSQKEAVASPPPVVPPHEGPPRRTKRSPDDPVERWLRG